MTTRTHLIAGATGDIGSALTRTLAKLANTKLILLDREEGALQTLKAAVGIDCQIFTHDIVQGSEQELERKLSEAGALTSAVYAIGVQKQHRLQDEAAWREVFDVNFFGAIRFANVVKGHLAASHDWNHLLFLSSAASRIGATTAGSYSASKAALNNFVKSMALSLAKQKTLVNAVAPGWIQSSLQQQAFSDMATIKQVPVADMSRALLSMSALSRMSETAEVANVISFLVSGAQTSITGQTIDVNNGLFLT